MVTALLADAVSARLGRPVAADFLMRLLRRVCRDLKYPATARHMDCSLLLSEEPGAAVPATLFEAAIGAVKAAHALSLDPIVARMDGSFPIPYPNVWPGEHYRLLAGLVATRQPRLIVEIGTGDGLSALAMKTQLPADGRIVTFDVADWRASSRTCLRDEDVADGRLSQVVGDLSDDSVFHRSQPLLANADVIFFDGPKDGRFEPALLARFEDMEFSGEPLIVFDDIRLWTMLGVWRGIRQPKLDLTSFGHWCGTGLVQWARPAGPRSQPPVNKETATCALS